MANYLAMNRDELTAEKAALEAKYKENKDNPKKMSGLAARLQAMQEQQQELQRKREELERKRKGLQ